MKYKVDNIVLLYSGETMHIYQVNQKSKTYSAVNCDDENDNRELKDSDIMMLVVSF